MEYFVNKYLEYKKFLWFFGVIILVSVVIYFFYSQAQSIKDLMNSIQMLNQRIANLEIGLASTTIDIDAQSNSLKESINDIVGSVDSLRKLSKTDKELLQKYSKVYFLSDNYVPMSLKYISDKYLYDLTKGFQFHTSALPFLQRMFEKASGDGISLKIVSAYRSFGTQSTLKNDYLMIYGTGANQFSADQGYSEHQLGTAVDITTEGLLADLEIGFGETSAFAWLENNAYKYGFILSYPKNNIYYQYEPWHWRFVGVGLATTLHRQGIDFLDMDQREIDTYLANIFE